MSKVVDIIIIGSGIAGLYAAYQIKRIAPPNTSFLILEKNKREWMGGRAGNQPFYGADVVVGAGVGRKNKDHALIKLLRDTKVKYSEFETTRNYHTNASFEPIGIMQIMSILKAEYKKHPETHEHKTFKQFFNELFGSDIYNEFVVMTGYTDFENADIYETLYHYGMDDNVSGWTALGISWNELTERLYDEIGGNHFHFSTEVKQIKQITIDPDNAKVQTPHQKSSSLSTVAGGRNPHFQPSNTVAGGRNPHHSNTVAGGRNPHFEITTTNNQKYYANKVVVATTISAVRKILPGASSHASIYQQIHGQPFLIVYAKFDKASNEIMKTYIHAFTVVNGPLQKLIPMDIDKGVYMIAYTDNQHAKGLKSKGTIENTPDVREMYSKWIKIALGIPKNTTLHIIAIRGYYWNDGTHYYAPLNKNDFKSRGEFIRKAQNPMKGMVVVGEMVSRDQGWVEGALESVDAVITREWTNIL